MNRFNSNTLNAAVSALLMTVALGAHAYEGAEAEAPEVIGHVRFHQKISDTSGGFTGTLTTGDLFGNSLASLGDLDGDGVVDIAVGAVFDSDGGALRGAVWILFLHPNGTVKTHQKISSVEGGFTGTLDDGDEFGAAVASLGDLDGDGNVDLAVGARNDDDGGLNRGAAWILFLHPNGTVKTHQKISSTDGGFTGTLADSDRFGSALASLGDFDGDGSADLAVGALFDDDGGFNRGAAWILFLDSNGMVNSHQKISSTDGGFSGNLDDGDRFGSSLAPLGDLDGDGTADLAIGAEGDSDNGLFRGAAWILFLNSDASVRDHQKINETAGGFTGTLDDGDLFGSAAASLGDLDCDGNPDLAIGANGDGDGGVDRGAVWIPFLARPGTVRLHTKVSDSSGGFVGTLDDGDYFGSSVTPVGDLDGDGNVDLAVGAYGDGDGGPGHGAVWILFLDGNGCYGEDTRHLFSDGFESGDTSAWNDTQL